MNNPQEQPGITITTAPYGKSGGIALTIRFADGTMHTDRCLVTDASKRAEFTDRLVAQFPALSRELLESELQRAAAGSVASASGGGGGDDENSQATLIVAMIEANENVELFHTPGGHDVAGFATITEEGRRQTWSLRSPAFRQWLSRMFYMSQEMVPGGQALTDAINTLNGKAVFDGPEHEVHVRVAWHEGDIWIDLADSEGRAVRVAKRGWEVMKGDIPVRFVRRQGMLPLPVPTVGGRISNLRGVVNLPDDDQWILAVSWLVAAFRPGRPFTLLNVTGEQGSAKSTLSKMLRKLIDPSKPMLRRPPKDDRDLMIASNNSWAVGYDNISSISNALSDSLCSLCTGGGFATRQLYTDDDEKIFDAIRPVIVNGIEDAVTRPDLLDRSINLHLPVIPVEERRDEDEVWEEFERLRSGILGAVLDAVVIGLRTIATIRLPSKPRMADFAMWVAACESALPWQPGQFLAAYAKNRNEANALALEGCAIGPTVLALMATVSFWEGSATDLQTDLNRRADETARQQEHWPHTAKGFAGQLRRIAPNLRAMGIYVTTFEPTGHEKRRLIRIEKGGKQRSATVAPPADPPPVPEGESMFDDGRSESVGWIPDSADRATVADGCSGPSLEGEVSP